VKQLGTDAACPYLSSVSRDCANCTQTCSRSLEQMETDARLNYYLVRLRCLDRAIAGDVAEFVEEMDIQQRKVNYGARKDAMDKRQVRTQWREDARIRYRGR